MTLLISEKSPNAGWSIWSPTIFCWLWNKSCALVQRVHTVEELLILCQHLNKQCCNQMYHPVHICDMTQFPGILYFHIEARGFPGRCRKGHCRHNTLNWFWYPADKRVAYEPFALFTLRRRIFSRHVSLQTYLWHIWYLVHYSVTV